MKLRIKKVVGRRIWYRIRDDDSRMWWSKFRGWTCDAHFAQCYPTRESARHVADKLRAKHETLELSLGNSIC